MAKDLKVVVLGYMASGKSTIGKALAKTLDIDFIDLDTAIETAVGLPVTEIFQQKGELFFRKTETDVLQEQLEKDGRFVLALGGGTPCYGRNMEIVNAHASHSYYLKLSIGNLIQRILREKEDRPMVASIKDEDLPEFIGKHLFERNPFYILANTTLVVDGLTVDEIVASLSQDLG